MSSEESLIEDSSDDNDDHESIQRLVKKGLLNIHFLGGVENLNVSLKALTGS